MQTPDSWRYGERRGSISSDISEDSVNVKPVSSQSKLVVSVLWHQ